ncbi:MAG TPA: dienelactone hydrolase family protein [Gemmatimonadaceae bacterium]|nr:dienelactone hydrolase family protein [Gemmatimonadaceae bacterium]
MQRRVPESSRLSMDDHMAGMSAADMAAPRIVRRAADQGVPGLPPSASTAKARIAASPRHGEWVKIAWEPGAKDSLMAWIVYPETTRPHTPVVVVVHEIFGLSTWIRGVADQVAADGFIAIAPDLLSRVRGGASADELSSDSAVKLIRGVAPAERNMGITAAANYAMGQPSAEHKYAVMGFCWGGYTTWGYATNEGTSGFSGGVAFYGLPYMDAAPNNAMPNADSLAKIKVPMMLLSGSKDARIGAAMPAVDSAMRAMHKDYFGKNYDGAIHGFARAQDDPKAQRDTVEEQANLSAIKDAWPRTVAFLKKHLGV